MLKDASYLDNVFKSKQSRRINKGKVHSPEITKYCFARWGHRADSSLPILKNLAKTHT